MERLELLRKDIDDREGHRYESQLKERITAYLVRERREGKSWKRLSKELGIPTCTLTRWTDGTNGASQKLLPVRTTSSHRGVTLVSPAGWKLEGLDPTEALVLMKAMSS